MMDICRKLVQKALWGLTEYDCKNAIQSACDFFGLPMPALIENLTAVPGGQTMFKRPAGGSYVDDVICYDFSELRSLGVKDFDALTLVFTHEVAHRVFVSHLLPGPDLGQWEQELVADFFMGVRAGLQGLDMRAVFNGILGTDGSGSHPVGKLRANYMAFGLYEGQIYRLHGQTGDVSEFYQLFLEYRRQHLAELHEAEMTIY